jgi:pimeloyl-ACP methyl ester carboxylesterase
MRAAAWFPEFWYGWRHQIAPLAEAGMRVVVPDQRRYAESDKPQGLAAYTRDALARYRVALSQPGALGSMLAWYRAAAQVGTEPLRSHRVQAPTLLIWGKRDRALGWRMAQPSIELCRAGRLVMLEEAGHFVALDAPSEVSRAIIDYVAS